jgi:putative acetyltransferase
MVRAFREAEIDRAAEIWLDTNVKAHAFISLQYWREHFEEVRGMLRQAELYVYEDESLHTVQGFIGLEGDYVAGIFVADGAQSGGIGRQLMDYVKALRPRLCLKVYQKNTRAVAFYVKESFHIQDESVDEATGEKEYFMIWNKPFTSRSSESPAASCDRIRESACKSRAGC